MKVEADEGVCFHITAINCKSSLFIFFMVAEVTGTDPLGPHGLNSIPINNSL